MLTNLHWICAGLMSLSGIAATPPAEKPEEPQAQVASVQQGESGAVAPQGEETEDPESAVSSPPMAMDDPGTPGNMGLEVNFVGTFIHAGSARGSESLLDANFGIGDRWQLKYERPYVTVDETGLAQQQGLGPSEIGVKWRFLDSHGWQAALYPNYLFDDGFTLKDEAGSPEESEGKAFSVPLLVSKNVAHVYTLAANVGYAKNIDHLTKDYVGALGVGRALGANGRVLAEVFSERDENLGNLQTDVRVGIVELLLPRKFAHSGYEFPVYASFGTSVGHTESGETVNSAVLGMSVIKLPKGE